MRAHGISMNAEDVLKDFAMLTALILSPEIQSTSIQTDFSGSGFGHQKADIEMSTAVSGR